MIDDMTDDSIPIRVERMSLGLAGREGDREAAGGDGGSRSGRSARRQGSRRQGANG
jgi:hypothetical protein